MAIILAKYVPFKRKKKLNRSIVGKILYVVCYISGSMCRKSNAVWSRLLIFNFTFFYSKIIGLCSCRSDVCFEQDQ